MEVTSPAVGRDAARLLKRRTLTDADLPAVKRVAASALTQRAVAIKTRPALAAYLRAGNMISRAQISDSLKRKLLAELERIVAPIAPPKP
jgi:hypothetical protein